MSKKLTELDLIKIRDESYREPPQKRCSTCRHFWMYAQRFVSVGVCAVAKIEGEAVYKDVNFAGVCDLWESKSDGK
jgi:hypothetical protein